MTIADITDILDLGSDLSLRYRYFVKASLAHPAKLHLGLLAWLVNRYTTPGDTILDPMAGVGSTLYAALLQRNVILREIEPRWLALAHENAARVIQEAGMFAGAIDIGQADAREPWNAQADHVIFSPPYACRAAPTKNLRVGILAHRLRNIAPDRRQGWLRVLNEESGANGALRFHYGEHSAQIGHLRNAPYWAAMTQIYASARTALRPDGLMILIIKDHIKDGVRVCVAEQTAMLCEELGFRLHARHARRVYPLSLWQRRRKERGLLVIEEEDVLVFRGVS